MVQPVQRCAQDWERDSSKAIHGGTSSASIYAKQCQRKTTAAHCQLQDVPAGTVTKVTPGRLLAYITQPGHSHHDIPTVHLVNHSVPRMSTWLRSCPRSPHRLRGRSAHHHCKMPSRQVRTHTGSQETSMPAHSSHRLHLGTLCCTRSTSTGSRGSARGPRIPAPSRDSEICHTVVLRHGRLQAHL